MSQRGHAASRAMERLESRYGPHLMRIPELAGIKPE